MIDIYTLTSAQLADKLTEWGESAFRAKQIWAWLYDKRAASFDAMTNLAAPLRAKLNAEMTLGALTLETEQIASDGTTKRLYRLHDGQMGFARHLTADEIFEQAMVYARDLEARGERLSNVVLMGMGEPFHNYDATLEAVRRLMRDLGIGARHITISTVGLVPAIRRFADEGLQVKLAVSLHAATDAERDALLPVNRRFPLRELIGACHEYVVKTGRRMSFEWTLIQGKNDTPEQANALGALLHGLHCHVNVIPLNPTPGFTGDPSAPRRIDDFIAALATYGIPATIRIRRGIDIDAGCGQLKANVLKRQREETL